MMQNAPTNSSFEPHSAALGAIGVYTHQLWLLWLGSGVIGGIGLGLGYISPVSTLVKWFPDRRGMATGMAIMGFGGGAMIGAPLADLLMNYFKTSTSVGVWQTFIAMGAIYFGFMLIGAFGYRYLKRGSWRSRTAFVDYMAEAWPEYNRLYAHPFEWTWSNQKMRQWVHKHGL